MLTIAATGHRTHLLPGCSQPRELGRLLVKLAEAELTARRPDLVIVGMALGWDTAVAMAALNLDIPYHAYVPFHGQESRWGRYDQLLYRGLLAQADEIQVICNAETSYAYVARDHAMVDAATEVLALYHRGMRARSGTAITVEYAEGWCVPVHNVWDTFMEAIQQNALASV